MAAKQILFLDHTAQLGGGELSLLDLLAGIDKSHFCPTVVLASSGPLVERIAELGISVHVVPLDPEVLHTRKDTLGLSAVLKIRSAFNILAYSLKISRIAKELKADLIHTNSLKSDIYGGLAGRMAAIPTVWHVRDRIDSDYLPTPAVKLFQFLCKILPHGVIANSQSTLNCLKLDERRISAVVYGSFRLDPQPDRESDNLYEKFAQPQDLSAPAGSPIIAVIGRLAKWKGQHVFIDAAAQVLKRHPHAQFWIVGAALFGEDDYENSLRQQVDRLGLSKKVHFLGFRSDIQRVLQQVTVVVHSSCVGEPFGRVVIEGMAAGKPVVATNGGALPEIITHNQTGMLVEMNDPQSMAEAVSDLLGSPTKAALIGKNARLKVAERFTVDQTVSGVQNIYGLVLSSNPRNLKHGIRRSQGLQQN